MKKQVPTEEPLPSIRQYLFGSFFIMLGYSVLMTGDVVMVKNLFPECAGDFAYAATLARLILFIPQSLVGAMFPKVVAEGRGSAKQQKLLKKTLLASLVSSSATALLFTVLARWLPQVLFGIEVPSVDLVRWLRVLSWVMVPVALLSSVMRYALAQYRFTIASVIPVAALGYVIVSFAFLKSPDALLVSLGFLSLLSLCVVSVAIFRDSERSVHE
ncbi:hypothetical protein EGM51_08895 [Verrucomicrobia bacterium S94]|nr:hypothetical protein EGM51_08895 [Verrucomicrobia bacterium S94]